MSSPDVPATRARAGNEGVRAVLDPAFGFFVWAFHFLTVYIAVAVACALGLGESSAAARTTFFVALIGITAIAGAIVVVHALRRYRQQHAMPERRFPMTLTIGCDALAATAIAWQLLPILLSPLCR
jgi:uncharacterized membrane protein YecN with MAPEG domain